MLLLISITAYTILDMTKRTIQIQDLIIGRKEMKQFFGLYICKADYSLDVVNDMEISDYKMIDNHCFLKEISEEEAFSDEYGFTMSYRKGITYNHSEKLLFHQIFL